MRQQLVELTSMALRPEPFDKEIERHCKHAQEEAPCPDCSETAITAGATVPRSDVLTADIPSHTPATHPLKDEHSR